MQPPMQVETVIVQQGIPYQGALMVQQGIPIQYAQKGAPESTYTQGMASENYPSQNYPPQNYAPQYYPQQNYPPGVNYGILVQGQMPEQLNQK